MKLGSILALVSSIPAMAAMATTADTSFLRKTSTKGSLGRGKSTGVDEITGYAGVLIVIDDVTKSQGASNDIVSKCLVDAFNTIHKNALDDFELNDAFVVKSVVIPNSNNNTALSAAPKCNPKRKKTCTTYQNIFWLETGYHCNLCNPDYDSSYLSQTNFIEKLVAEKDGNMHKALEAEFRNELIASGDEALAKVARCEIDFTRPAAAATTTTTTASATSAFDSKEGMSQTQYEAEARLTNVGRRRRPKKDDNATRGGYAGVILSIHRVKDSLDWNKDAISNCLVTAYNKVNQKSDYTLDTAFIQKSVSIPEAGDVGEELEVIEFDTVDKHQRRKAVYSYEVFWLYTGFHCRLCCRENRKGGCQRGPRQLQGAMDFDFLPALLAAQETDVHKDFEAEFCAELKQTGGPAMANITDCEVQFTYTSPTIMEEEVDALFDSFDVVSSSQEVSDMVPLQESQKETMTSQIQIFHVTGSEFDIAGHQLLTTQAFIEAFNTINNGGDVTMAAVDLLRRIDIPQDDDDDEDDADNDEPDDNDDGPFDRLWWASVTFTRTGTPEEDMVSLSTSPFELFMSDPAAHKAFEQLFYLKLKNSGMLAYADISGSDISFSYPTLSSEKVNSIALQE